MRWSVLAGGIALCLGMTLTAVGQAPAVNPEDLQNLLRVLDSGHSTEAPAVFQTPEGFLRFLGAPPGGHFLVPATPKAGSPEAVAQTFIEAHAGAFGLSNPHVTLAPKQVTARGGNTFVRLDQRYAGLPVYGAQVMVQLDGSGNVRNVLSDVMRDVRSLDEGDIDLAPAITEAQAQALARSAVATAIEGISVSDLDAGPAELIVYRPAVLGLEGPSRLVFKVETFTLEPEPVAQLLLVDAASGEVVLRFSQLEEAKERRILDAANTFILPDKPIRIEGDLPTGIADVDAAYDYYGDTYDFYKNSHNRDSYDDKGSPMVATVRVPVFNAFWFGGLEEMFIGTGLAVDDVISHELTHGVTQFTSDLIYQGFSGAINESFSDIWGEYVDLVNGKGNDSDAVRWFIGEDIRAVGEGSPEGKQGPDPEDIPKNAFRYMKDPTLYGDPDRLGSPLLINPNSFFDNGGVHINSGIGNKLCYLLTDGDTFNNETIVGLGIEQVADLFYETQFILTPASDYFDLYFALSAATAALGFSFEERLNVAAACRAVEIEPSNIGQEGLRNFQATPTRDNLNNPVVALSWTPPPADNFARVILLRSVTGFVSDPNQGVEIVRGRIDRFLDTQVQEGVTYYYTLIADLNNGFPQRAFAQATAGETPPSIPVELFTSSTAIGGGNPVDLAFSQLLFTPVGAPRSGLNANIGAGTFSNYEVTIKHDVFGLPVARNDGDGGSFLIPLTDDGGVFYTFSSEFFPFFGTRYSQLFVASNGYVAFAPVDLFSSNNFPSLAAHFSDARLSFLFGDLAPNISGEAWIRELPDRLVITYQGIPEFRTGIFSGPPPNTVQVELYFSGHIRITYQDLGIRNAVVGLSDGRGVPVDPTVLFPNVQPVLSFTNLSSLPAAPGQLSLNPVAPVRMDPGDLGSFTIQTAGGGGGLPRLRALWDGPISVPFADNGRGGGVFTWRPGFQDAGVYTVRVLAVLGAQDAYQDVRLVVGEVDELPEVLNLRISTSTPFEDPFQSRTVSVDRPLQGAYDYYHPNMLVDPDLFGEGPSLIYWYRDSLLVSSRINTLDIPASATRAGEQWNFRVIPITANFVAGEETISPTVTINGMPEILSISPGFGSVQGGVTVRIRGDRLNSPTAVKFGGVDAAVFRSISRTELEAVTPLHAAGPVAVSVTTPAGTGALPNAFLYAGSTASIITADVNLDGKVDAVDVQLVVSAVLKSGGPKADYNADANRDGNVNASDIQVVVSTALRR